MQARKNYLTKAAKTAHITSLVFGLAASVSRSESKMARMCFMAWKFQKDESS